MRIDASVVGRFAPTPLRVVHLGQSALVLEAAIAEPGPARLTILTVEGAGTMPGGACLDLLEFDRLRALLVAIGPGLVDLSAWSATAESVERIELHLPERALAPRAVATLLDALGRLAPSRTLPTPDPLRRLAPQLAQQAVVGGVRPELLRTLVGAGPGTTPSGDDVIVGVLAGLRTRGERHAALALGRLVLPLLATTTAASGHYLLAAVEGRFGEHVHELVSSLAEARPPAATIAQASRWGATSGIDLLFGLAAAWGAGAAHGTIGAAA